MNFLSRIEISATAPMDRTRIIYWWESRRIRYNLLVGLTGVISLLLVVVFGSMAAKQGDDFEEPMGLIVFPIVFGVIANLCYTSGWNTDLAFYRGTPRYKLFRVGLIFSIVLASLPGIWAVIAWLFTVCTGKKMD
jgi:hypothetical protein